MRTTRMAALAVAAALAIGACGGDDDNGDGAENTPEAATPAAAGETPMVTPVPDADGADEAAEG